MNTFQGLCPGDRVTYRTRNGETREAPVVACFPSHVVVTGSLTVRGHTFGCPVVVDAMNYVGVVR